MLAYAFEQPNAAVTAYSPFPTFRCVLASLYEALSVHRLVCNAFVKNYEITFWIKLNVGRSNEEKERWGGTSDKECEKVKKWKKYKNKKVAWGRIVDQWLPLIFAGVPLFLSEMSIGQFSSSGAVNVWRLCPLFRGMGFAMVMVSGVVAPYYNMIIAWAFVFLYHSFTTTLPWWDWRGRVTSRAYYIRLSLRRIIDSIFSLANFFQFQFLCLVCAIAYQMFHSQYWTSWLNSESRRSDRTCTINSY